MEEENIDNPLVISYENDMMRNPNSQAFKASLDKYGWEYLFIGEGEKWEGFKTKINGYYNCLLKLHLEKTVILSDARDVFCLRSPFYYVQRTKDILNDKILVSSESFLVGHMDWTDDIIQKRISEDPDFFWQGIPLNKYWAYYNKTNDLPLRKYVNSGLISGKVKHVLNAFKWIIDNNYTDDQLGVAEYTNHFPELVTLDYEAKFLHTSTFLTDGGLYDIEKQHLDSPTIAEILGMSSYFLHIPGVNGSKGQMYLFNLLKKILNETETKDCMYKLYGITPSPDFKRQQYFVKNTE